MMVVGLVVIRRRGLRRNLAHSTFGKRCKGRGAEKRFEEAHDIQSLCERRKNDWT